MSRSTEADSAMERYAGGDPDAFSVVYDAVAPRIYGYLLRQTRRREHAEDLLQQTMLRIHKARGSFKPGAQVTPWAFAIARRLMIDSMRQSRCELLSVDWQPDPGVSAEAGADDLLYARQLASRMEQVLAALPQSQRAAYELLKQEGLSMSEAAEVLGTTVGAVKLRAHRAYEALRAALGDSLQDSSAVVGAPSL